MRSTHCELAHIECQIAHPPCTFSIFFIICLACTQKKIKTTKNRIRHGYDILEECSHILIIMFLVYKHIRIHVGIKHIYTLTYCLVVLHTNSNPYFWNVMHQLFFSLSNIFTHVFWCSFLWITHICNWIKVSREVTPACRARLQKELRGCIVC